MAEKYLKFALTKIKGRGSFLNDQDDLFKAIEMSDALVTRNFLLATRDLAEYKAGVQVRSDSFIYQD